MNQQTEESTDKTDIPPSQFSIYHLAALVIRVLDQQKKYFKTRDREDLIASKDMEKDLREKAQMVLANPELFSAGGQL